MRARCGLAAFAVALGLAAGGSADASTADGKIVFMSSATGNYDIYTMNADGSGVTNLTNSPFSDQLPSWSPDKARIAFSSRRSGNRDIYVIDADGSGETRITTDPGSDQFPEWSPDGSRILYSTSNAAGATDLYTSASDGSGDVQQITNDAGFDGDATYSPDGEKIAYTHGDAPLPFLAPPAIWVIHADGSHPKQLTPLSMNAAWPDWSPDGSRIAFANNVCPTCDNSDIFTMNPGGNHVRQLTHEMGNNVQPHWSADGSQIAFTNADTTVTFIEDVWTMDADGGNPVDLTKSPFADDQGPDW